MARHLERDQARLYELIWKRTVASQMASAELEQTTADIEVTGRDGKPTACAPPARSCSSKASSSVYEEGRDDRVRLVEKGKEDHSEDDDSRRLPRACPGRPRHGPRHRGQAALHRSRRRAISEATLVKRMEELGIGRPSTYASTLAVLQERDYVRIDKKRLIPEDKGRLVTAFLESFFKRYVEYDFTADLEEKLDLISDGKLEWKDVLRDFWRDFIGAVGEIKDLRVGDVLEALNEILGPHIFPPKADGGDPRQCPNCGEGRLSLKVAASSAPSSAARNYPDCRFTRQFSDTQNGSDPEASTPDGKLLGHDPETGSPVTLRTGRFGPYVQLGEAEGEEKPKRSSIPKGVDANTIDLEHALQLLSLPREIGLHPETRQADHGRPRPLRSVHPARRHLRQPADGGGGVHASASTAPSCCWPRRRPAAARAASSAPRRPCSRSWASIPSEGGKVQVLSGRYGPYVKHGDVNATLPRAKEPAALTMDEAVQLIAERAAKGPSKPKGRAQPSKAPSRRTATAQAGEGRARPAKAKAASRRSAKPKKPKPGGTREAAE